MTGLGRAAESAETPWGGAGARATVRPGALTGGSIPPQATTVKFWFATGGAGFCLSRGLALKMSPWAR